MSSFTPYNTCCESKRESTAKTTYLKKATSPDHISVWLFKKLCLEYPNTVQAVQPLFKRGIVLFRIMEPKLCMSCFQEK